MLTGRASGVTFFVLTKKVTKENSRLVSHLVQIRKIIVRDVVRCKEEEGAIAGYGD